MSRNYFAPRIASLAALATRNWTTRLAAIDLFAVAGLRPMRALRLTRRACRGPERKVFFAFLWPGRRCSMISTACFS